MERQGPDHRRRIHIDAIRVRARGLPGSTAHGLADGLGPAIAEALSARGMTRPAPAQAPIPRVDLGRIAADGRSGATLRAEIASRIAASLARPTVSKG